MFKLYHFSTWSGPVINLAGILRPSPDYLKDGPPLVWLSTNDEWEPCIQAKQIGIPYTRGPSTLEHYSGQGIPCWRFEVEVPYLYKLHYNIPGWVAMLKDGEELGSDVSQWHWTTGSVNVINSFKWENQRWKKV